MDGDWPREKAEAAAAAEAPRKGSMVGGGGGHGLNREDFTGDKFGQMCALRLFCQADF